MLRDHSREKLLNAITYFIKNTRYCGKVKLFNLLYFLDFEHYMHVGRSVTGLYYFAWERGPVPRVLFEEFDTPGKDLAEMFDTGEKSSQQMFEFDPSIPEPVLEINPQWQFDKKHFTKRELRIMEQLAGEYYNSEAMDMMEATRLKNRPWHKVYEVDGNERGRIPYYLALRKAEYREVKKIVDEHEEFIRNYG